MRHSDLSVQLSLPENRPDYTESTCAYPSRFSHLLDLWDSPGSGGKERKRKTNLELNLETQAGKHDDAKGCDKWVLEGNLTEGCKALCLCVTPNKFYNSYVLTPISS